MSPQAKKVLQLLNNKRNGHYVDIGCGAPIGQSNTYELEMDYGWSGVGYDPNPNTIAMYEGVRNNPVHAKGIFTRPGTMDYWGYIDGSDHCLGGLVETYDPNHLRRFRRENSYETVIMSQVEVITFNENIDPIHIDYLDIDTEGSELEILQSIDWNKYSVDIMSIECQYGKVPTTIEYLASIGYNNLGTYGTDYMFRKAS